MQYPMSTTNGTNHFSPFTLPTPFFQPIVPVPDSKSEGKFPYKKGDKVFFIQQVNGITTVTPTTFMPLKRTHPPPETNLPPPPSTSIEQNNNVTTEDKPKETKSIEKESEPTVDDLPALDNPSDPIKIRLPKCARCHVEFVNIKNGRRMKTCKECLKKSKYNQRRSLRLKEFFTNSVICSTCNRNVAMVKGRKQYHTCEACILKKKVKYDSQKEVSKSKRKIKQQPIEFAYDYVNNIRTAFGKV